MTLWIFSFFFKLYYIHMNNGIFSTIAYVALSLSLSPTPYHTLLIKIVK